MIEEYPSDFHPKQNEITYTKCSSFWIENGIVHIYTHPKVIDTLENAKFFVSLLDEKIPNQRLPMICDVRGSAQVSKEVRKYYASDEGTRHCKKFAFMVSSSFSRVVANFFIGFSAAKYPIKMFVEPDNAVKWCEES